MNGEIEQLSRIVCCARKAMLEHKDIEFSPCQYVRSVQFVFASPFVFMPSARADSVQDWFRLCQKRGLREVKLILPTATEQRHLLGFANTSQGAILCRWKSGKNSYFVPTWNVYGQQQGWAVVYKECRNAAVPKTDIAPNNKTDEFKAVLSEIGAFAEEIGFPYFSEVFRKAYNALCDAEQIDAAVVPSEIPDGFKGIYYAVSIADVFGAMGSWNDSPPCYADEKGLTHRYNQLSDQLLYQLRYHLMYITNHCREQN